MDLDIKDYSLQSDSLAKMKTKKSVRQKKGQFIRGPIDADWIAVAGNLPGKSLQVGMAMWWARGFEKEPRFKFTAKWYGLFDLSPATVRRGLHRLQEAGLIRLEYRPGRAPVVTMLDAPDDRPTGVP